MTTVFITGKYCTGKTVYATFITHIKVLHYFITSPGSDPLRHYNSEPCIILDGFSGKDFRAVYDVLKSLNLKLLIVTSRQDISIFKSNAFIDLFFDYYIEMGTDEYMSFYSPSEGCYMCCGRYRKPEHVIEATYHNGLLYQLTLSAPELLELVKED